MASEALIVPPDPERIVEGLRDTGYEFHTAIADLIDNSIAAGAHLVDVLVEMDLGGTIRVAIADDGCGMNRTGLINAMKYGSQRRTDSSSLGKFGLGLKTASTAFCRHLSVSSRPDRASAVMCATWDLDHIAEKGDWELLLSEAEAEALEHLDRVSPVNSGTVVTWQKTDRLLARQYDKPGGKAAQTALQRKVKQLYDHLSLVYQRYLDATDERARTLRLVLNGEQVAAWDPFAAGESEVVASEIVPAEMPDGSPAEFTVRAFVLPRKEEFSDPGRAALARISNDAQGLYIYRENRLIHGPDWLGMFQKEPHFSLIRVEFSFDHRLDAAFHMDIKKSQILLDEELWLFLKDDFLPSARRAAEQRYRNGQRRQIAKTAKGAHDASNVSIGQRAADLDSSRITVVDSSTDEVLVTNAQGNSTLRLKILRANRPGEVYVQPVSSIDDGVLWEPALIDGKKGVRINTGHPYYEKVYVPNLSSGVTVQGMDSLLWALCVAELGTVSPATQQHFGDLRYEVGRILRRLVDSLPEPALPDDAD